MRFAHLVFVSAFFAATTCAQQQVSQPPVETAPPSVTAPSIDNAGSSEPAKVNLPSTGMLHDGTPLKLRFHNALNSRTAKTGDQIDFDVVNNVVVGGVTVLKRGAPVVGVVTEAASSKTMGRAGRLSFVIRDIPLASGTKVSVRAFNRSGGENTTGQMVDLMLNVPIAAAPFMLLIHGTNTVFERGTEINAFVNGDVKLDLNTFGSLPLVPPLSAPPVIEPVKESDPRKN